MKVSDFTNLLQTPEKVNSPLLVKQLEEVAHSYPYFQAARALHLKGLKNLNSYKYNQALKYTAACTADREVLFDFITSENFLQNSIADAISGKQSLEEQETFAEEVGPSPDTDTSLVEQEEDSPLPRSSKEADQILDPKLFRSKDPSIDVSIEASRKAAEKELQLGKPLEFTKSERHSFTEWLQLTSFKKEPQKESGKPAATPESKDLPATGTTSRKRKFELIDKFIEENPKISPDSKNVAEVNIKESLQLDKSELMTETLARVYLEQGKFKKAVQAYRILSLKYPEKSGFFADQIKAVEKLRQDKPNKKK
ncbi:hypothetical protein [Robiginitalea sp. IMCC43444]|uniref:hypothetical protein n=1 Tax=Robiginitalea sp. IMCC43444 TaxID=3459121 RepID=UPI0040436519